MDTNAIKMGLIAALTGLSGCGDANATTDAKNLPSVTSKETVVTNADGSVTKTRVEMKEFKDASGKVVGHETSSYSETTFDSAAATEAQAAKEDPDAKAGGGEKAAADEKTAPAKPDTDSFLGLKFGETVPGGDKAEDAAGDRTLKVVKFTPAKPLEGFDDYYAFVTPKTRKLVKVCACAKNAIDGGAFNRHHYLVEALERRYRKRAWLASYFRPVYSIDIAPDRGVSIFLAGASDDYETMITAWDDGAARLAADEYRELRDEAYREAVEKRNAKVREAESAF